MKTFLSFLVLALFSISSVLSQEKPPEIFPPAPTASELGKFGSYPVDLASGLPRIEIPLYTVTSGDIKIPITLKYHASGIKVNQMPSWVGLGWALDTGGIISLETRDSPDELEPNPYTIPNWNYLQNIISTDPYNFDHPDIQNVIKNSWVKDAYHISLPTVSGTFFLDSNNDGEVTTKFPPDEFKIYKSNPISYLYKVIDKQGVQYEFNDYEESRLNKTSSQPGDDLHLYNTKYKSAWLLSKIKNTKGDSIEYFYGNKYTTVNEGQSHSKSYSYSTGRNNGLYEYIANIQPWKISQSSSSTFANKLQEIKFPNGRARFIMATNPQFDGVDGASGTFLDRIIIETGDAIAGYTVLKTFRFYYSITGDPNFYTSSNSNKYRFKLDKVTEVNPLLEVKEIASFEYSNVQLPKSESYSIDYFGLYNGKNNANLIPERYIAYKPTAYGGERTERIGQADRSINTMTMQAGMLTKIKYPTKGYTQFEFESNAFYGKNLFLKDEYITQTSYIDGRGDGSQLPGLCAEELPEECDVQTKTINFNTDTSTTLSIRSNFTCDFCNNINSKYSFAKYQVKNNNSTIYSYNFYGDIGEIEKLIAVSPGTVSIIFEVYGDRVHAGIETSYWNRLGNLPDENVQGFGLRVKSITNYDANDEFISQKAYQYTIPNTANSSGKLINSDPKYDRLSEYTNFNFSSCNPHPNYSETNTYTYSSSSRTGFENNSITYEYVTELEKDSLGNTNGKTVYKYTTFPNEVADAANGSIWVNLGHKRGQLLKKETYNEQGKILIKEENEFSENTAINSIRNDFKVYDHGYSDFPAHSDDLCLTRSEIGMTLSNTKSYFNTALQIFWYKKDKTDVTQYFYDATGTLVNQVLTTTDFTYNDSNQEIQKTVTTDSENDVLETSYKYAQDLNDTRLITDNRISMPLEIKVLEGTEIINHSKTTYADFNGTYLTSEIFNKKGALVDTNNSDDRKYVFDSYEHGKITQYHIENGATTSIIWGYNQQYPVAKIENATYAAATATLTVSELTAIKGGTYNQSTMITTLNKIRTGLPDAMITTYTYDPLVGVTSVTDPKGYTTYYEYDVFNRLEFVKDADGNLLSENKYNYKN
ncbi:RHS repeat protein [Flavivirga sp. 57AJ16]|uniref:RHS repeat protein n=1 Tax=Flavivirga sp. 57AJ16 TaxID=3025307 RepID=UPI002366AB3E|nr:RHS repeat domain-containing protein [Flavivirga sp. 57AJ16]MDD7888274.1 RHS repeat protein [Flavivirga sp. 57AJ16]